MRFAEAHARGVPEASAFLSSAHRDPAERRAWVAGARRPIAPPVLEAVRRVNRPLAPSPARDAHLAELASGEAACVVTGQQCGLFGGPLYSVHKAAAAVRLAARLRDETGAPVVPVFWLQTEDHDAAEIEAHVAVGASGAHTVQRVTPQLGARASVAHATIPDAVGTSLDALDAAWEDLPHGETMAEWLRERWQPGARWADAFARTLGDLFSEAGLVVFPGRAPEVARAAAPLHRWAIHERAGVSAALAERAERLRAAGWNVQVPVREACALSFVHPEGEHGPRYRLQALEGRWRCAGAPGGAPLDAATLDAWLRDDPLRFSTSALLRPLVQDHLLPCAAYVGGPSEVAYLAQIAALYPSAGVSPSMVVARPSWCWVPQPVRDDAAQWGLPESALREGVDACLARLAPARNEDDAQGPRARLQAGVAATLDALLAEHASLPAEEREGLERAARRTRNTASRYFARFQRTLERAERRRDRARLAALTRACGWLQPGGRAQERSLGFGSLAAWAGLDALVAAALEAADPLDGPAALRNETPPEGIVLASPSLSQKA